MISKIVSTKMIRNFIESDEEIQVIGFLDETNERAYRNPITHTE